MNGGVLRNSEQWINLRRRVWVCFHEAVTHTGNKSVEVTEIARITELFGELESDVNAKGKSNPHGEDWLRSSGL